MKDLKKENELLKEQIVVLRNYLNILKKKNKINKDSMLRVEKIIYLKDDEIYRLKKELKEYERKYRNNN